VHRALDFGEEILGLVVLEAWMLKRAIVASKVGSQVEGTRHHVGGPLVSGTRR